MAKTKFFAKGKEGFLKKLFGAAVLSLGLFAFVGTKAMAATEAEPNDTLRNATEFSIDEEVSGTQPDQRDVDWYKFTLTEPGTVYVVVNNEYTRDGYGRVALYNEDGFTEYWNLDYNFTQTSLRAESEGINLAPGTYSIKAWDFFHWDINTTARKYSIKIDFVTNEGRSIEAENNDTADRANEIVLNQKTEGQLSYESDVDWYKFTISESSAVSVSFDHFYYGFTASPWRLNLYSDLNSETVYYSEKYYGPEKAIITSDKYYLSPGTYYINVERGNSYVSLPYGITVNCEGTAVITMLRLYNPNTGEHFYTSSEREKNALVKQGWSFEGKAWEAPEWSNTPVYRLYNKNSGDHHYTPSKKERDNLVKQGWTDEGIGWYSDDNKSVPLFRLYNPNAVTGQHHDTTSARERDKLVQQGWKDEGTGWYGLPESK